MAEKVYITIPDEQAQALCDLVRKKLQSSVTYRSGDLASEIEKTLGVFCRCTAEKVVDS